MRSVYKFWSEILDIYEYLHQYYDQNGNEKHTDVIRRQNLLSKISSEKYNITKTNITSKEEILMRSFINILMELLRLQKHISRNTKLKQKS